MSAREYTTFGQTRIIANQIPATSAWSTRHMMRPDEAAAARMVVCANATDAADARMLLDLLGLIPGAPAPKRSHSRKEASE